MLEEGTPVCRLLKSTEPEGSWFIPGGLKICEQLPSVSWRQWHGVNFAGLCVRASEFRRRAITIPPFRRLHLNRLKSSNPLTIFPV